MGSGVGTILFLKRTWDRTLLLMLRGHPVLPTSPQGTNATEGGAEVLLAISRELRESAKTGPMSEKFLKNVVRRSAR